ncbi:MAG: DUF2442 domain-containing protein [Cyanobacteria bacterium QH_8_48_120]|nr:MAG: DUF2442 domain-containing protein [Cyanobacteria bacterium QH_10_48_56]PSO55177.1 MAG: DUF2442 domain-containing protein [Cyanobacteria bacterium QH_1_48_107]PSO59394.1 MAG: DUF2442 domain-containing protein [Cyanobacteria bacterium QH_2_48_84]PSO62418.1 MAG: DUF2442 domain-containing protein [Cyanobacteria bacterium QH_6_48_35]PSO62441.1 MAG: DUF2442 domain-containing protein [Cyanobacteria bacterium QH_7_48_89]PSO72826.1 MAG: DUF2442 domain-containing protein [Cyanobacteria bacterium
MTTLTLETDPIVNQVIVTDEKLIVDLADGRSLSVPLAWYPRLMHASSEERQNWQLLGDGYVIEWSDLDEHIGIEGLLAGRRSSESQRSLERWLATRTTSAN